MWPILLDMSKVDCKRMLRRLELEAYGNLVSALRAQGGLSSEKHKLLQEISSTLNIPQERHQAEIRRAVNDERLATIAYCMTGDDTTDEWALEGRRLVPLMPRVVPQTAYSVIADDEANKASVENEKLPLPANTERKRPLQTTTTEPNKTIQHATSEFPNKHPNQCNSEETAVKKRKTSVSMESSTLAQHLIMGPPKISRVQQLYRQKTKAILKQQMKRTAPTQHITNIQKPHRKADEESKGNISHSQPQKVTIESKNVSIPINNTSIVTSENIIQTKITTVQTNVKANISNSNVVKVQTPVVVNASEVTSKSVKICPARKVITGTSRAQNQTQKLIIVSNSQGNTTSSILQHTLTIPFVKTISMKNLDKLKVINNTSTSSNTITTTTNQKPKLVTVHTKVKSNVAGKQLNIPFIQGVQLQALQNKGAIKMVPVSTTKITTKPSGPVYIMNTNPNLSAVTTSNSSPIMTSKLQNSTENTDQKVYLIKNESIKNFSNDNNNQNVVLLNVQQKTEKSSVLTDILKASGVIPNDETDLSEDNEITDVISSEQCDIESQITQLTEIPNADEEICETIDSVDMEVIKNDDIKMEVEEESHEQPFEQYESIEEVTDVPEQLIEPIVEDSEYVILKDDTFPEDDKNMLVCTVEDEEPKYNTEEVLEVIGSLDPETGMYSIQDNSDELDVIVKQEVNEPYVIELDSIHNTELDMPTLSLN